MIAGIRWRFLWPLFAFLVLPAMLGGCALRLPAPAAVRYDAALAERPPACTHAGTPIPLPVTYPAQFPSHFPLPAHVSITQVVVLPGRVTVTRGYIASTEFERTANFFESYLPLSGYSVQPVLVRRSRVDESFYGRGYSGVWELTELPACPGELELTVQSVQGVPTGSRQRIDPY